MISVRVVRRPDGVEPSSGGVAVGAGGVIIGRSLDCDLVLEDPVRLVSRQHVQLLPWGVNEALLRCISATVSISVNADSLAPGSERLVSVGDRLRIGGFELQIDAANGNEGAVVPPVGASSAAPDPLQMLDEVVMRAAAPSALVPAPALRPVPMPSVAPQSIRAPAAAPDVAAAPAPARPASVPSPAPPAPAPARFAPALVPAPATASAPMPAAAARSRLDHWFDLDDVADPLADSPLPKFGSTAEATPAPATGPMPGTDAPRRDHSMPAAVAVGIPVAAPAPPTIVAVPPSLGIPVATPEPAAGGDDALMRAFLRGAGLSAGEAAPAWTVSAAWMQHVGTVLRAATEGTLALLRSRAVTKRSIRAEGTHIALRENNPLKFAPDAAEALAMLLGKQSAPGFLDPLDAVRDANNDLLVHQLAMVAGMRAAVFELISRLGPDMVEAQQGPPKGLARRVPLLHEAALWRRHRQQHAHLIANLDDDFEAVFGREFLVAYEAQSRLAALQRPGSAERP